LPYKKIIAYLSEVGRERDIEELCYKAMVGLEELVKADCSVLQMVGPGRTLLPTSRTHNLSEEALKEYRAYYFKLDPGRRIYPEGITVIAAKWADIPADKEFVDFLRKHRILASGGVFLYDFQDELFAFLNVHIGSESGFSKQAVTIMHIVQPLLNNLLANLTLPTPLEPETVTDMETILDHRILSKREAEIAGLLCRRFTAKQIGEKLGISTRTVERHMEHIYWKLGVTRKEEILKLLVWGLKTRGKNSGKWDS